MMITEIKGYVKAYRISLMRVMALVMALAVLCAGTAFAAAGDPYTVDIYEGSQITRAETTRKDAYAVVNEADIKLSENDRLMLNKFVPGEYSKITVCRASNVTLVKEDGNTVNTVFAGTVGELLEEQGIVLGENLVSSVSVKAVVTEGMEIRILNSYNLTINADNEKRIVNSTAADVGELLAEQNIFLGENDEVLPSAETALSNGMVIDVLRVEFVTREAEETVAFATKTAYSSALEKGKTKVAREGKDGKKTVVYEDKVVNGEVKSSKAVSEKVTVKAVDKLVTVGTLTKSTVLGLGNNKVEKNAKPISELSLPSKYTIGPDGIPTSYKKTITGKAAAYCIPGGTTSTGKAVKPGYIAVNPKQIPYGTEMWIVSDDGVVYGYAIAADTGGFAQKGTFTVDLYMNSKTQCYQWGARNVTIYIL